MAAKSDSRDSIHNRLSSSSERKRIDQPSDFVLGPGRLSNGETVPNNSFYVVKTDGEHQKDLYEHLSVSLGDLLSRVDLSDCYLNVRGTFMAVHKCILAARSTSFSAVISNQVSNVDPGTKTKIETMTHKDKLVIMINKVLPEIMKLVVIFMYTGRCELNDVNAYALLDAAGRYDIKDLKVHTGRFLSSRIDNANVLMLLKAAYKYENMMIKQHCIEYFINNAKEIMAVRELWKKFAEENQEIVAELLHWLVNRDLFYNERPRWDAASHW